MPVVIVLSKRVKHFEREVLRSQHQTRIRSKTRYRRFAITDDDGSAPGSRGKEQLRKIVGQTNAAVAGGVSRKLAGVHGDACPGKSLHVRHRCVVVLL